MEISVRTKASRMYDTADYNTTTADSVEYIYLSLASASQLGGEALALADYMGLGVKLNKK